MDMNSQGGNGCRCPHHKVGTPLFLILLGALFLAGDYGWVSASVVNTGWPILLILWGLVKMCGGSCKCCGAK